MPVSDYSTALVTGASSGIGEALVAQLTAKGVKVTAVARRGDRLRALQDRTGCDVHELDLTDTAAIARDFANRDFDILVNNAGHGRGFTALAETDTADIDASINTNVRAVYHLIRAVLPGMIERDRGYIVNLGSMAGLYAVPTSIYGGAKGAVHNISRNLRLELQGKRIRVTEICPGRVATEFYDAAIDDPQLRKKLKTSGVNELTSDDVADAIMYCLDTPPHVNINLLELQPVEQTYGGSQFTPFERSTS